MRGKGWRENGIQDDGDKDQLLTEEHKPTAALCSRHELVDLLELGTLISAHAHIVIERETRTMFSRDGHNSAGMPSSSNIMVTFSGK